MKEFFSKEVIRKLLGVTLSLVIALISIFVIGKYATSPETYRQTIQSIDDKKAIVMGVTTASAAASTALAAVPGDATTPIANQIMNISSYLLVVVCALVLENALLTVFGYLAFKIMIPIACGSFAISLFAKGDFFKKLALKIVVFAMVITFIIPFSLKISDLIYETNKSTVIELTEEVDKMDESEDKSWWESIADKVEDGTVTLVEKSKQIMNNFIDVIALFIITYCAIPIIVFLVVIWFVKFLFNIDVPVHAIEKIHITKKEQ